MGTTKILLVDGYNVIHRVPELRPTLLYGDFGRQQGREQLPGARRVRPALGLHHEREGPGEVGEGENLARRQGPRPQDRCRDQRRTEEEVRANGLAANCEPAALTTVAPRKYDSCADQKALIGIEGRFICLNSRVYFGAFLRAEHGIKSSTANPFENSFGVFMMSDTIRPSTTENDSRFV